MTVDVITAASNAIRGLIVATPGKKLVVSDLANIEGRMCAWLAGEEWKLDAYRTYDTIIGVDERGKPVRAGPDLYIAAYAKAFDVDPATVGDPSDERQIGKVMELMLQYEGGVGAFLTGAATYNIDLDDMARRALPNIPGETLKQASDFWTWQRSKHRSTFGLERDTFIACDALKRLWRDAHPAIVSGWKDLHAACVLAITLPGRDVPWQRLTIRRDGAWLRIISPILSPCADGTFKRRCICYASPQVDDKGRITFMGLSPYSKKWKRQSTYGGKVMENVTQFMAAEVIKTNAFHAESMGYEIVLSVHDELLTETPDDDRYTAAELSELLVMAIDGAEGLPLAAKGAEMKRYAKD